MATDIIMEDTIVADIITTVDTDTEGVTTIMADTDTITDVVTGHRWVTMVIIKAKNNIRTDTTIRKTETIAMMETDIKRTRKINAIAIKKIEIIQKIKTGAIQTAAIEVTDLELRRIIIEEVKAAEAVMSEHIILVDEDRYVNV